MPAAVINFQNKMSPESVPTAEIWHMQGSAHDSLAVRAAVIARPALAPEYRKSMVSGHGCNVYSIYTVHSLTASTTDYHS